MDNFKAANPATKEPPTHRIPQSMVDSGASDSIPRVGMLRAWLKTKAANAKGINFLLEADENTIDAKAEPASRTQTKL